MQTKPSQVGPYLFLSYASADRERALHVADLLEARGISVWIDRKSIAGGTSWSAEIVRGIKGCSALLIACSPDAAASPNVQQEIQLAWENRRPLVPLLLAPTRFPESMEYALAGRQWIEALDHAEASWLPQLLNALRLLGVAEAPAALPPTDTILLPAHVAPRHNLPAQLSSFVGRSVELAEIRRLLQTTRLLTVTGVGGTGKTRLALQVAADLLDRYPDGVWFVDLAPLSDPALVPRAVASALSIPEQANQTLVATLVDTLRELSLLVILDNCEHLIDACAHATDTILRGCPTVQILATSREPLGITGEVSWRLPSLPVPTGDWRLADDAGSLAALAQFDAVQLFVQRAQAVDQSFELTSQNAAALAQICRRLDGIPLALELAAARVKVFSVERIATRLDDQFRLLTGGSRAALPRQQTLRALIDWSHALLSEPERVLFRRLAVFAGGCTYEAIEGACGGDGLDALDLPDVLARLVDRSLVVAERRAGERYRLLEPLRQYGQEKLIEAGETERLRDRHRDWYLRLALEAEKHSWGPDQGRWYDVLEEDHDNFRAAIEWCIDRGNTRDGLEFVWEMGPFWLWRGYYEECRSFCERLLALASAVVPTRGRAHALLTLGSFSRDSGYKRQAYEEADEIFRKIGEPRWAAVSRGFLADLAAGEGDERRAEEIEQERLAVARQTNDRWLEGHVFESMAEAARRLGEYSRALALMEQSLACYQAVGDIRAIGCAYCLIGLALLNLGDFAQARPNVQRGLAVARELKITVRIVEALIIEAAVDRLSGDPASGQRWIEQAIQTALEARDLSAASLARLNLAYHAWVTGNPTAAAQGLRQETRSVGVYGINIFDGTAVDGVALGGLLLLGGERAMEGVQLLGAAHRFGFRPTLRFPDERQRYEAVVAEARLRLGEEAFAAAWASGQAMSLEQAWDDALSPDPDR